LKSAAPSTSSLHTTTSKREDKNKSPLNNKRYKKEEIANAVKDENGKHDPDKYNNKDDVLPHAEK
jgi:hypothetical protein